jgi:beta-glucosidase
MHASDLSLDEKTALLAGKDFWHTGDIPGKVRPLRLSDGPHGLRKQKPGESGTDPHISYPATCYPTESALACSFNVALLERIGAALGEECRTQAVDVLLGPGVNMKRDPRCGRNFEYFSEDPVLAGELAAAYIRGVQSQGIGTCLKHFAVNSQERKRMVSDSIVDERALHEAYLPAFECAIRSGHPWMLMTAYNRLNGTYCSENQELIALARSWGFAGAVISDWGAMSDSIASVTAGLSLCMPGPRPDHVIKVREAVADGRLTEDQVDACVAPLLTLTQHVADGRDGHHAAADGRTATDRCAPTASIPATATQPIASPTDTDDSQSDVPPAQSARWHALAQEAAEQSAVLLKNDDTLLPLSPDTHIAVIGAYAEYPRFQGGGSAQVNARHVDTPLEALQQTFPHLSYAPAYDPLTGEATRESAAEAARLAHDAQVAIVFLGQASDAESEGYDRADLSLPASQQELLNALHTINPHIVAMLQCGAPVETPWRTQVQALLVTYLGGEACGSALARLLTGAANPSGKLAETWPESLSDVPCKAAGYPDDHDRVFYRESLFTGYRWYDATHIPAAFPFGFGLSYTQFSFGRLSIEETGENVTVRVDVRNTGTYPGAEVVQVYVAPLTQTAFHAPQQLKAFAKVHLEPDAHCTVTLTLSERDFSYWSTDAHEWRLEGGDFEIRVGSSSRDIHLRQTIHIDDNQPAAAPGDQTPELAAYQAPQPGGFTDAAFTALLGRPLPEPDRPRTPLTIDSPVSDLDQSFLGHLALHIVRWVGTKIVGGGAGATALLDHMLQEVPLRAGIMEDFIDMSRIEALVHLLNHESGVVAALRTNYGKRLKHRN